MVVHIHTFLQKVRRTLKSERFEANYFSTVLFIFIAVILLAFTITVLASPEQARIITEMENDGVAHVALISRNNDQLAEELLAEQDKTLQEIYFPETLVEENAESQDGGEAAEGAADGESTGEAGSDGAEGGTETTPADSIPEDGE